MAKKGRVYWPSYRYGPAVNPVTGEHEARVFNNESEVPKGWQDHPSKFDKKQAEPEKPSDEMAVPDNVDRKMITEQLDARKVTYGGNLSNKKLYKLLWDNLTEEERALVTKI